MGEELRSFRRARVTVFSLLFFAYVGFYFCRVNFLASMPALETSFGFTNTQTGLILSSYFTVYSVAKFLNGLLGARVAGKVILLIGVAGSVVCNVAFGFGAALGFFVVVWSTNAYFQSMGWLGLVGVMSQWYTSVESGKLMGLMSMSYLLGDLAARSSAGTILRLSSDWRPLFWIHAGIFAGVGLIVWLFLRSSPESTGLRESAIESEAQAQPGRRSEAGQQAGPDAKSATGDESARWLRRMLSHRWFWIACVLYLGLSIIRYIFWSWSIVYLAGSGLRTSTAVFGSAVFPLVGSAGAVFAGWVSDRMEARRGPVLVTMCSGLVVAILLFSLIPSDRPLLLVPALALVGFTLTGPYSLMAGAMAIDFGSRHTSATAAGIIDAVGAVGAIFSGVGMGYLVDNYGWANAFTIVILIAVASTALSATLWNFKPLQEARTAVEAVTVAG